MLIMLLSVFRPCLFLTHSDQTLILSVSCPHPLSFFISSFSLAQSSLTGELSLTSTLMSVIDVALLYSSSSHSEKKNPDLNGDAVFSTPAERYMREKNTPSTQLPLRIIICSIDDSKSFLDSVCLNLHFPILHLPWSLSILFVFSLTIVDVKEYQTTCWLDFKHGDRGCQ